MNRIRIHFGFTLIELLVVIAVISVLASLFMPALSKAKAKAKTIDCLGDKRQLAIAWLMYADDNNDWLVPNTGGNGSVIVEIDYFDRYSWIIGRMSWRSAPDVTNYWGLTALPNARLAPYFGFSPKPYKCPADTYLSPAQKELGWRERVRSVSMNKCMGDGDLRELKPGGKLVGAKGNQMIGNVYLRLTDFKKLTPSMAWVIIDEHPDTITDEMFNFPTGFALPANYHNRGCTLNYADGHAEFKKWQSKTYLQPVYLNDEKLASAIADPIVSTDYRDSDWLWYRTSEYFYMQLLH